MNVFLPVFDLFLKEGGGETIYRQIISTMKDHTFYYLSFDEPKHANRPHNVIAVPFNFHYASARKNKEIPHYLYDLFLLNMNMARSVADAHPEITFDVIDTPDYSQNGVFIGQALKHHGIHYDQIVLAMHGNISTSVKYNWPGHDSKAHSKKLASLRILENLQYQTVDHRYAISPQYAARWNKKFNGLSCSIIDPLVFLDIPKEFPVIDNNAKADIYCICRKERCKGPDIFIDLLWFLPKHLYNQAFLIGAEDNTGDGSEYHLKRAAKIRGMEINNLPAVPRKKVMELFTHKAINVVPSRYESLSLSALESLLQGCPTIISSRCGAVEYLKEYRPEIPFHEIDISCSRDGTQKLQYIIENYAEERAKLIAAIQSLPVIDKTAALQKIYGNDKSAKISVRQTTNQLFSQFLYLNDSNKKNLAFAIKQVITKHSSIPLRAVTLKVLGKNLNIARKIKRLLTNSGTQKRQIEHNFKRIAKLVLNDPKSIAQWYFTLSSNSLKKLIHHVSPEKNLQDIREKIQLIENLTANRYVDRARYYYELAILENKRNNPLISAVYKARIMRWQHKDIYSDLDNTAYTFNQLGYRAEAEALLAIHSPTSTYDSQLALLNKKLADHKKKPDMPFEFIDDKREKKNYKISVIVSLYKAADKFATFIRMLEQQTAIQANDVEVVFIDSGSPTDEYSIFKQYDGILKNAMVYARSQNRETIQCAWNRGIKLCTGTYLTFQAADEAIHPECLEILSKELDNNPTVDWIMGSAIVAEIDKQETLHCDIMAYDRSDAKHHSHILDCTYVNYTPGLYRKSVHDLHGFYDETFSAAGDTEFKNRVSPFINIKFIPNVLGAYNNYQEERTTAHPRAEIEDIRAWYLFRTPAGIAYLFQNRSEEELLDVLRDTLGYRKSFCGHISTDIELGLSVSIYLHKKTGNEKYQLLANEYRQLIDSCNNVELFNSTRSPLKTVVKETRAFSKTKKNISKMLSMPSIQSTSIFHDNRYEQHWWPWRNTK